MTQQLHKRFSNQEVKENLADNVEQSGDLFQPLSASPLCGTSIENVGKEL